MMQEFDLEKVRGSLAQLSLASVVLGDFLMVLNSTFDIFIDEEPYLASVFLLNTKSGVYNMRVWSHSILRGEILTMDHLVQICKDQFSQGRPCIGITYAWIGKDEEECSLLSQTPTPRKVSKSCLKFVKNYYDEQCSECKKMNISQILTNVSVTIKGSSSSAKTEDILMSPILEFKEDGVTDSCDFNQTSFSSTEHSPMPVEDELKPVPIPYTNGLIEKSNSKKCPWCNKEIICSGDSNLFQEHRQACLSLVLETNVVNKEIKQIAVVSCEPVQESKGYINEGPAIRRQTTTEYLTTEFQMHCQECQKNFHSLSSFTLHNKFVHFWGIFNCPTCFEEFNFADSLIQHIKDHEEHTENLKCICPICREWFSLTSLPNHYKKCVRTELQREKFPAVLQSPELRNIERSPTKSAKRETQKRCQGEGRGNYPRLSKSLSPNQISDRVICPLCGNSFKNEKMLAKHNRIHLREQGATIDENGGNYKDLYFTCNHCGKKFVTKEGRTLHIKTAHEKVNQNWTCEVCGITFITKERLGRHKILYHSTDEQYNCKYCGKRFSATSWLKRHIASNHEEPRFQCSFCDKSFTFKHKLEGHENEHRGVKPYSCDICGLSYHKIGGYRQHMRKKHGHGRGTASRFPGASASF